MLSGDVPFVHLSPRRPCDALRCYKRNCSAPVPEREDMAHAEAALCACGHLNKYCTICKAFFERVVPHPRPPDRDRMGYHYTGHPPRQNIACRELYRLASEWRRGGGHRLPQSTTRAPPFVFPALSPTAAPPCTCKDTDKAAKGQAAAPPAAAVSQVSRPMPACHRLFEILGAPAGPPSRGSGANFL